MTKPRASRADEKPCVWRCEQDEYMDGCWRTTCRRLFELTEGTPTENNFHFCPNCGKPLKEGKAK